MNVFGLIHQYGFWEIVKDGIRFKIYYPLLHMKAALWDHYHNVDTENIVTLSSLGISEDVGTRYEATPHYELMTILKSLKIKSNDVFLDVGSGKGRVLLLAGRFQFRKVIGVDISNDLNKIALSNVNKMQVKLSCKNYEIVLADASAYKIPEDVTHVFFFNPLFKEAVCMVLDNLIKSTQSTPRAITCISYNPKFPEEFKRRGFNIAQELVFKPFSLCESRAIVYELAQNFKREIAS